MAIQSDGKIVVAGHGIGARTDLVARLDTDGSLDTTFGNGGFIVLLPNSPGPLVIQADGWQVGPPEFRRCCASPLRGNWTPVRRQNQE
jgi:hypothetical protein